MRATVKEQHKYAQQIIWAARDRIEQRHWRGIPVDMFTVWTDFDPDSGKTFPTKQRHFPKWKGLCEYLKLQIAGVCVLATKGYTFSARLNPDLDELWSRKGYDCYELIKRRLANEFRKAGLTNVGYAFVVEGKSRKGVRTGLHIHGFFYFEEDPWYPDKVKLAIEAALEVGPFRQGMRRSRDVQVELMYDPCIRDGGRPGRWAAYSTKNTAKPDDRLPNKRIFLNTRMTRMTKEMWGQIKEVPRGEE